jgi:hypothetical protein
MHRKAKTGGSFPDLNKDGKVTRADILKGRGVIAKKGNTVKKAFLGSLLGGMGSNLLGGAIGGMMGGGGGGASSTALQNNNAKLNMPNLSGSMKKGGKVVAKKKARSGTSVKKAQGGYTLNEGADALAGSAGAMKKTKVKERSPDGDYVTKRVTRTTPTGKSTKTTVRRSIQGIIGGAPRVNNMVYKPNNPSMSQKNGGSTKKAQDGDSIKKPSVRMTSTKNYDVKETTYPRGDKETTTKFNPRGGAKFNIPPISKKKAKSGTTVKKCRYGCK